MINQKILEVDRSKYVVVAGVGFEMWMFTFDYQETVIEIFFHLAQDLMGFTQTGPRSATLTFTTYYNPFCGLSSWLFLSPILHSPYFYTYKYNEWYICKYISKYILSKIHWYRKRKSLFLSLQVPPSVDNFQSSCCWKHQL